MFSGLGLARGPLMRHAGKAGPSSLVCSRGEESGHRGAAIALVPISLLAVGALVRFDMSAIAT